MQRRHGEGGAIPHRNGRLRCIGEQWFFAMRGAYLYGPYHDQDAAEQALQEELARLYGRRAQS